MTCLPRRMFMLIVVALVALPPSVRAHGITITGTTTFSALDGSADDHDGSADGTFTVDDGDLTIAGTITCNDDPPLGASASACPMRFVVSGTFAMQPGGAIVAENRRGAGNGGNITVEAGGDIVLAGAAGALPGALISSSRITTTNPSGNSGGAIDLDANGGIELAAGSIVAANALNATGGAVNLQADGEVVIAGLVTSGPSSQVLATALTGRVLDGDSNNQAGGPISISTACVTEPAITITGTGAIVSQGESPGAGVIDLAGCGIAVRGLIASISKDDTSTVKLRSGAGLLVDGQDLSNPAAPTARLGRVRADGTNNGTALSRVLLLADDDIQVFGAPSGTFVVTSDPGAKAGSSGGSIVTTAINGGIDAAGMAFRAGVLGSQNAGGSIDLAAAGAIDLDLSRLDAVGGYSGANPMGRGGSIAVRSYASGVSWTSGVGDVRPTGTGVTADRRGSIAVTACDAIDLTGSQFPTNGAPVPPFPLETTGVCTQPQPSLPAGEALPVCVDTAPGVSTTSPADGATDVARNTDIVVTFTEAVDLADATAFTLECPVGSPQVFTLAPPPPGGVDSFTLDPSADLPGEVCTMTVVASRVTDVDTNDPPDNMVADFSFSFTVVDAAPTAVDDTATVAEDSGPTAIDVLANDTDPDGGPKTIQSVAQPANGNVVITGAGTGLTYQPNANYCNMPPGTAPDTFTYTLEPGGSVGTVSVTVTCINDPPVAQPKAYAAQANMKLVGLSGLLADVTDADAGVNGCTPTFTVGAVSATSPAGGTITNLNSAAGSFDFEPPPGVTGNVTFTYTVQDDGCPGTATSAPASVTVVVAGPVIWFVDSTAPAGGNGTWTGTNAKAFQTLAQAAAVDASDHRIFVINNSGSSVTYADGIALNAGEWLVGQGVTDTTFDTAMAVAPPIGTVPRPSVNGVRPTFAGTVQVNTRSPGNVVRLLGFNLATGTSTGLTNGGTTINGVTADLGSVTTSTGTAVSITGTGNGSTAANALRFISVSANGAANGIDLRNAIGTFEVTGDGANTSVGGNASGGTIANISGGDGLTTGNGVYLENVRNVTLRRMTIAGTNQNHGIRGIAVNGFTLEFSTVSGTNGTSAGLDEGSVNFDNLTGSASITSSVIEGGFEENLNVVNTAGTLDRLTITGSTFGFNHTVNGNNNILIEAQNAATVLNFTLQSSLIKGARADWINASAGSGSSMSAIIGGSTGALGNTFDNLTANAHPGAAAGGNRVVLGATATMTVDVRNNALRGARGEAIRVRSTGVAGGPTGTVSGHVRNNTIGAQATADSGSSEGSGIFVFGDGGSDMTLAVTGNQVSQYNNHGILVQFGDEINEGSVFNVTVTANTVSTPGTINTDFNAIHLNNGTVAATDNFTSCVDIGGAGVENSVAGGGKGTIAPNNADIRLRQRQSTTVRLPGYAGANNDDAAVVAYLTGRNILTTAAASNTVPTGGGFIGGAACIVP